MLAEGLGAISSCGDVLLSLNDSGLSSKVPNMAYASYACLNFVWRKDPCQWMSYAL